MDAARLPEVFDFKGLVVRSFPAECATGFRHLSQSEKKATPAVVRRIYAAAAKYVEADAECLICGQAAPVEGRVLIAMDDQIGVVCAACAAWGLR